MAAHEGGRSGVRLVTSGIAGALDRRQARLADKGRATFEEAKRSNARRRLLRRLADPAHHAPFEEGDPLVHAPQAWQLPGARIEGGQCLDGDVVDAGRAGRRPAPQAQRLDAVARVLRPGLEEPRASAAAPAPAPAAAPAAPTEPPSIKEMKETIRKAGLATADLLERPHVEERYKKALARLAKAVDLTV